MKAGRGRIKVVHPASREDYFFWEEGASAPCTGSLALDLKDPAHPVFQVRPEKMPLSSNDRENADEPFLAFWLPLMPELAPERVAQCMDSLVPQCEKLVAGCVQKSGGRGQIELDYDHGMAIAIQEEIYRQLRPTGAQIPVVGEDGLDAPLQ
ncbi:MAG: hypothetical protein K6C33_05705 [Desulfovibrio sp.]|nr:hypothetical protein [Desulfovibrio sp.]